MGESALLVRAALVGVGGTIALDVWALVLARVFNVPGTKWAMVGRWLGNMPRGVFVHRAIADAPPVAGEAAIGWIFHYAVGIGYGLLLFAWGGQPWLERPAPLQPLLLVWAALVLPYFVMMPGMGSGIAGAKTPRPNVARLKSFVSHSVFGLGMYGTAVALA